MVILHFRFFKKRSRNSENLLVTLIFFSIFFISPTQIKAMYREKAELFEREDSTILTCTLTDPNGINVYNASIFSFLEF